MNFESWVVAFCDRFTSQRAFELIIVPALADLEFEEELGRRGRMAGRVAVLRAIGGAVMHDMSRESSGFLKLALLSAAYYSFPIAVSVRIFKTWSDFFVALTVVLALSLVPVLVCFWPVRHPVRHGD
jgi:hypothetical protein